MHCWFLQTLDEHLPQAVCGHMETSQQSVQKGAAQLSLTLHPLADGPAVHMKGVEMLQVLVPLHRSPQLFEQFSLVAGGAAVTLGFVGAAVVLAGGLVAQVDTSQQSEQPGLMLHAEAEAAHPFLSAPAVHMKGFLAAQGLASHCALLHAGHLMAQPEMSQQLVQVVVLANQLGLVAQPPVAEPATQAYGAEVPHLALPHCELAQGVVQSIAERPLERPTTRMAATMRQRMVCRIGT